MNFLESAVILVSALAGITLSVYNGDSNILTEFEQKYCFSPNMQKIFTAAELKSFLENSSDEFIYEIIEPLESHLILFKIDYQWILLGPYVEDGWDEPSARSLLARLGASETMISPYHSYRCKLPISQQDYAVKIAFLIIEHMTGNGSIQKVKTVHTASESQTSAPFFLNAYEDMQIINRRYHLEECFLRAVSHGDIEKTYEILEEFKIICSNLRFVSEDLRDQLVSATITRTLIRIGSRMAGLSPVLIDSISQEYAQKMQHTVSKAELEYLTVHLAEQFCMEIKARQNTNYSTYVQRAIDYIHMHLSDPVTISEVAKAAGVNHTQLVKLFGKETGKTVKQYLAEKRCDIAAELLMNSRISVQEIAAYAGYADNNYFAKVFKANKGVSPQEYRKAHWLFI